MLPYLRNPIRHLRGLILLVSLIQCSPGGETQVTGGSQTVTGLITDTTGNQTEMSGWYLSLYDMTTHRTFPSEITDKGEFSFTSLTSGSLLGLFLLDPNFQLRASFAYPSFRMSASPLPRFIHRGDLIEPQSLTGIAVTKATGTLTLPPFLNSDDDQDGILDPFDSDSKGVNDQRFTSLPMDWISVTLHLATQTDGTHVRSLRFLLKISDTSPLPTSVTVLGDESLYPANWDGIKTLEDDGLHDDLGAKDRLYGRKIVLDTDKTPLENQVVFLQAHYGTTTYSVGYLFPPVSLSPISGTYNATEQVITRDGDPFDSETSYSWYVSLYQVKGDTTVKVYTSSAIAGDTSTFTIPSGLLQTGVTYRYKVIAQALEKIPGYTPYIVESALLDF